MTHSREMNTWNNPIWWNQMHDRAWERVKDAFKRNWNQKNYEYGVHPEVDQSRHTAKELTNRNVLNILSRLAFYEEAEPAYCFGYGARLHYGVRFSEWNVELEFRLKADWEMADRRRRSRWLQDRELVLRGWDYATHQFNDLEYQNNR